MALYEYRSQTPEMVVCINIARNTVLDPKVSHTCTQQICIRTPAYIGILTSNLTMATTASTELDLKRTSFVLSPEERSLGSSLDNDLHPLYQRFSFRASALTYNTTGEEIGEPFLEERVYDRMVPAFRLASLLLDFSLPFLTKVFCADLVFAGEQYAFSPVYECTDEDIQRVRDLLVEWAGRTRFYCRTPDPPPGPDGLTFEAISEIRTGGRPLPTPAHTLIYIKLRTIEFFSQENYDAVDTETKTSQLVQLAFVLVHEQAHAVFCHRWAEDPDLSDGQRAFISRVTPREPMYHMHMDPRYHELGFAMQAWIHGGSVLSRGKDLMFVKYPGDVLGESTTAQRYPFRGDLLSRDFWQTVRVAPRPSTYWHGDDLPTGWLGQAMAELRSTDAE